MNPPLRFLWKRLKALLHKRAVRVRHNAGKDDFHSNSEDEEAFWAWVVLEELFD